MRGIRRSVALPFCITGLWLVLALGSCSNWQETDRFSEHIAQLQKQLVPPGSTIVNHSGMVRNSMSVAARWEFETEWTWEQYSTWLGGQLQGEFNLMRATGSEIVFSKQMRGDTETVRATIKSTGRKTLVRLEFAAFPN